MRCKVSRSGEWEMAAVEGDRAEYHQAEKGEPDALVAPVGMFGTWSRELKHCGRVKILRDWNAAKKVKEYEKGGAGSGHFCM